MEYTSQYIWNDYDINIINHIEYSIMYRIQTQLLKYCDMYSCKVNPLYVYEYTYLKHVNESTKSKAWNTRKSYIIMRDAITTWFTVY